MRSARRGSWTRYSPADSSPDHLEDPYMDMNQTQKQDENEKFERMAQIARAFSPSAPIDRRAFAGRVAQITDVINACTQRGQHVVIFGERGAGKTSLANALVHMLGSRFATLACGSIN